MQQDSEHIKKDAIDVILNCTNYYYDGLIQELSTRLRGGKSLNSNNQSLNSIGDSHQTEVFQNLNLCSLAFCS